MRRLSWYSFHFLPCYLACSGSVFCDAHLFSCVLPLHFHENQLADRIWDPTEIKIIVIWKCRSQFLNANWLMQSYVLVFTCNRTLAYMLTFHQISVYLPSTCLDHLECHIWIFHDKLYHEVFYGPTWYV